MEYEVKKFRFYMSTGYVGCQREETVEIEIPVGASEEEIEEIVQEYFDEWMWNYLDTLWGEIKED